jgi:hypothetical protein
MISPFGKGGLRGILWEINQIISPNPSLPKRRINLVEKGS